MISFAKKFLSIALAAVLLLGVLPGVAFAEDVSADVVVVEGDGTDAGTPVKVGGYPTTITFGMGDQPLKSHFTNRLKTYLDQYGLAIVKVIYAGNGDDISVRPISAPDHDFKVFVQHIHHVGGPTVVTKEPTCTEAGESIETCAYCGHKEVVSVPAIPHAYTVETADRQDPTCGTDGYVVMKCATCDKTEKKILPAAGEHTPGEWETAKEAAPGVPGEKIQKCTVCGKTLSTAEIPALPSEGTPLTITVVTKEGKNEISQTFSVNAGKSYTESQIVAKIALFDPATETYSIDYAGIVPGTPIYKNHTVTVTVTAKSTTPETPDKPVTPETPDKPATPDTDTVVPGMKYELYLDDNHPNGAVTGPYYFEYGQVLGTVPYVTNKAGKIREPALTNYVFCGWNTKPDGTGVTYNEFSKMNFNGPVRLYAHWEKQCKLVLEVYRNGDTVHPVEVHTNWDYCALDVIDVPNDLPFSKYYNNGRIGPNVTFRGWFGQDGWDALRLGKNPAAIPTQGLIEYPNGEIHLYMMVNDPNVKTTNNKADLTNPKTGDESMIIATTAVMLVSAGALAVFFMDRKRRNG